MISRRGKAVLSATKKLGDTHLLPPLTKGGSRGIFRVTWTTNQLGKSPLSPLFQRGEFISDDLNKIKSDRQSHFERANL